MKSILKKLRMFLLLSFKYDFKVVGENFYMGRNNLINCASLVVGKSVYIGNNCHLSVSLLIEDFVMLASQVSIVGGDHKFDEVGVPIRYSGRSNRKGVVIKKDCWIGHGAIILDGVVVGEGCIIAAGSVITKSTESYSIYGGVPAIKLRNRFKNSENDKLHSKNIILYETNHTIF
jgi:chloramphenicol O-acetyltransferase type B